MSGNKRKREVSGTLSVFTNYISQENSITKTAAASFDGTFVYCSQYAVVAVSVFCEAGSGTVTVEGSFDGTGSTADALLSVAPVIADTLFFKRLALKHPYVRVIWQADAGTPLTTIYTVLEKQGISPDDLTFTGGTGVGITEAPTGTYTISSTLTPVNSDVQVTPVAGGYTVDVGSSATGANSIKLTNGTGDNLNDVSAIAIGLNAGRTSQGPRTIAIGERAGLNFQGDRCIAIGNRAGENNQGIGTEWEQSIAIGSDCALLDQGQLSVAIGPGCANTRQGVQCVAVGRFAGGTDQGSYAVAIADTAGQVTQGIGAVAIGLSSAQNLQGNNAIAIGRECARNSQGNEAIAIGRECARDSQGFNAVAMGYRCAQISQTPSSVAIGYLAGNLNQGFANGGAGNAVAIGPQAGETEQSQYTVAIGAQSGETNQGNAATAVGRLAGQGVSGVSFQGDNAVALGNSAGRYGQGARAIAIGLQAAQGTADGLNPQPAGSIAIGANCPTPSAVNQLAFQAAAPITIAPTQVESPTFLIPLDWNGVSCRVVALSNTATDLKLTSTMMHVMPLGEISFENHAAPTLISVDAANTSYLLNPVTTLNTNSASAGGGGAAFFTSTVSGRLTYSGAITQKFHVAISIDVQSSGGANKTWSFSLFKNGVFVPRSRYEIENAGTDEFTFANHIVVELSTTDYVEVYFQNMTDNSDLFVHNFNLVAMGSIGS